MDIQAGKDKKIEIVFNIVVYILIHEIRKQNTKAETLYSEDTGAEERKCILFPFPIREEIMFQSRSLKFKEKLTSLVGNEHQQEKDYYYNWLQ